MAHYNQQKFIEAILIKYANEESVIINVGSADVNGNFKKNKCQIDIDLCEVAGVNVIATASSLPLLSKCADIYISAECFEHNMEWKKSIHEAIRILKDEGIGILTIASLVRYEHGTNRTTPLASPGTKALGWDYYKNLYHKEVENQILQSKEKCEYKILYNYYSSDLYVFINKKKFENKIKELENIIQKLKGENSLVFEAENWIEPLKLSIKIILSLIARYFSYNITNEMVYLMKKIKIKK